MEPRELSQLLMNQGFTKTTKEVRYRRPDIRFVLEIEGDSTLIPVDSEERARDLLVVEPKSDGLYYAVRSTPDFDPDDADAWDGARRILASAGGGGVTAERVVDFLRQQGVDVAGLTRREQELLRQARRVANGLTNDDVMESFRKAVAAYDGMATDV